MGYFFGILDSEGPKVYFEKSERKAKARRKGILKASKSKIVAVSNILKGTSPPAMLFCATLKKPRQSQVIKGDAFTVENRMKS